MAHEADTGSKRLIGQDASGWARWVTGLTHLFVRKVLGSGDFQWIARATDIVIEVYSPVHGHFLILIDIQFRYDARMHRRTQAYAALAEEKFNLPVYPVVIYLFAPGPQTVIPERYEQDFMGLVARRDFRVIKLWEEDVNTVFTTPLRFLLAFAPLMRGGNQPAVLRQVLAILRSDPMLADMEPVLAFLASFVFERSYIEEVMRWDMAVITESPLYKEVMQDILEQGMEKGKQEGIEEGIEIGMEQGKRESLLSGLELRFGQLPVDVVQRLQVLTPEQLKHLFKTMILAPTLEAFLAELPNGVHEA
ncbi:MAG: Rpn family recombination-promoting nuclease/putative transposase [Chloroflexaceae bacterium]|nr:Rpn family recombination-promoting nuclease/putative transposase [Chloroflexaceae bacterium]